MTDRGPATRGFGDQRRFVRQCPWTSTPAPAAGEQVAPTLHRLQAWPFPSAGSVTSAPPSSLPVRRRGRRSHAKNRQRAPTGKPMRHGRQPSGIVAFTPDRIMDAATISQRDRGRLYAILRARRTAAVCTAEATACHRRTSSPSRPAARATQRLAPLSCRLGRGGCRDARRRSSPEGDNEPPRSPPNPGRFTGRPVSVGVHVRPSARVQRSVHLCPATRVEGWRQTAHRRIVRDLP